MVKKIRVQASRLYIEQLLISRRIVAKILGSIIREQMPENPVNIN